MIESMTNRRNLNNELSGHLKTLPPQEEKEYKKWSDEAQEKFSAVEKDRAKYSEEIKSKPIDELKETQKKMMEEAKSKEQPYMFKTLEERRKEKDQQKQTQNQNQTQSQTQSNQPRMTKAFTDGEEQWAAERQAQMKKDREGM